MNQNKILTRIELSDTPLTIELMDALDFNERNQWCIDKGWS